MEPQPLRLKKSQLIKLKNSIQKGAVARTYVMRHINHIVTILPDESKKLYVMDRGYPSLEIIIHLIEMGVEFAIRLSKTTFKREQQSMKENDETKDVIILDSQKF